MDDLNADAPISIGKIYTMRAIWAGTFLGGPLVAGYFVAENYKTLGEPELAKKTWGYVIFATLVIFGLVLLVPDPDKIPKQIIPIIYTLITYFIVEKYQGSKIGTYIDNGGLTYKWWRVLGITLIGTAITFIVIVFLAVFVMR